jgi:hypothetical protein
MIKIVTTLKKKEGISTEDFRAYYEDHHRLIGEKYLAGYATRYVRRYLHSIPDTEGNLSPLQFDVLLEIWFPDASAFMACSKRLNEPDVAREIVLDEERLFDRSERRSYTVEEFESVMDW